MKTKSKPLVIAHIIGKWVGGGVESVVMNYYQNINTKNIQFDFICDEDSTNIPVDEIKSLGGNVIFVPPYQDLINYQKELKKVFIKKKYKIVHSHINTLSVFPLRVAKKCGIPIRIAHSHSTTNKKEWKRNLLKTFLKPFSKIYSTHYFACGEVAGRYLFGNKTYNKGNVFLLNNAIKLEKFIYNSDIRKKKRKELGIDDNKLVIGHVGRFVTQKNHSFLLEIFNEVNKKNPNTILLLIGQGPLKDKIKEEAKKMGLENSIKFLGQRSDVNELYQAFDILLLPSLYEGLSVVGVEAQAAGLLCFFSDLVTKELQILETTQFLSLKNDPSIWADSILKKYKKFKRKKCLKEMKLYDIKNQVLILEKKI